MKSIRHLAIAAAIISGMSGLAYADSNASAQVGASVSLVNSGTVSASWVPAAGMSGNSGAGSEIGSLDISFSGGNTIVIKDAIPQEMPNMFTWTNDSDSGEKLYGDAYYQGKIVNTNVGGEAVVRNLDGKNNIQVVFKKESNQKLKPGNYSNTLLVDLYTL
ncbi:hypothetical protein K1Y38_27075 [Serratia marcescens]|uniref:hypothetical protein n=1 Tax=Serratia marcescens TaxID=615 RepID=UPI0022382B1E|nr:hypothetical protein [Serratia marcescens]MCW6016413.1 hypothetical protein [Serratia marcescens]MCW6025662.1 hypothetical protein [Serratia marcescens]